MSFQSVSDLKCQVCFNLFDKPAIVNCGHSFCSECIVAWLQTHDTCPVCRVYAQKTIRNITLEQIVDQFSGEHSVSDASGEIPLPKADCIPDCDSDDCVPSSLSGVDPFSRSSNGRSSRRCRFSKDDVVVVIDQSPDGVPRQAPPPSARPLRSSLARSNSTPSPNYDTEQETQVALESPDISMMYNANEDSEDDNVECGQFQRNAPHRRSEVLHVQHERSSSPIDSPFERASRLRRSIGAIRCSRSEQNKIDGVQHLNATRSLNTAAVADTSEVRDKRLSSSRLKAIWKRLIPFKIKRRNSTMPPPAFPPPPSSPDFACPRIAPGSVCSYSGSGRSFQKMDRGQEITIVVFGKRAVGKTTFLDNAALSVESCSSARLRMVGMSERLSWSGQTRHSHGQGMPLAHMMTFVLTSDDGRCYVIDIIDAECDTQVISGKLPSDSPSSFLKVSDAAVLLYSCMDTASLLTTMSTHRQLQPKNVPCILLGNVYSGVHRLVKEDMGRGIARNMGLAHWEVDLIQPGFLVIQVLQSLCRSVLLSRGEDVNFLDNGIW